MTPLQRLLRSGVLPALMAVVVSVIVARMADATFNAYDAFHRLQTQRRIDAAVLPHCAKHGGTGNYATVCGQVRAVAAVDAYVFAMRSALSPGSVRDVAQLIPPQEKYLSRSACALSVALFWLTFFVCSTAI